MHSKADMDVNATGAKPNVRNNCFTLLRYVFFFCIMCNHYFVINGKEESLINSNFFVQGFFIISGLLVYQSYGRTRSVKEFAKKRFLRLYPAYFVVVMAGFVMGLAVTKLPLHDFFSTSATWKYLCSNLVFLNFLQPTLPGVFADNPLPYINSPLWTLKVEVMFYFTVPIVWHLVKRYGENKVLLPIIVFSVLCNVATYILYSKTGSGIFYTINHQIIGELAYFYFPVYAWRYREKILENRWVVIVAFVVLAVRLFEYTLTITDVFTLTVVYLTIAYKARFLFSVSNVTDYSYEMYLLHFPTLQLLMMLAMPCSPLAFMAALMCIFLMSVGLHAISHRFGYERLGKRM